MVVIFETTLEEGYEFKMLRFFSRRKQKGRKDQRYGSGGYSNVANGDFRKPLGPTSKSKSLECKVVFLNEEDDTFHITVRFFCQSSFNRLL